MPNSDGTIITAGYDRFMTRPSKTGAFGIGQSQAQDWVRFDCEANEEQKKISLISENSPQGLLCIAYCTMYHWISL